MDGYEFAAKMTESLAWPVVATVAILVFRNDARRGVARLLKLDAFGISAEFAALEQLELEVSKLETPNNTEHHREVSDPAVEPGAPAGSPVAPPSNLTTDTDSRNPSQIIIEEWNSFQNFAVEIYPRLVDPAPQVFMVGDMFDHMGREGLLSAAQVEAAKAAIKVRNKVAFQEHIPTAEEAQRYKVALHRLRAYVEHRLPPT